MKLITVQDVPGDSVEIQELKLPHDPSAYNDGSAVAPVDQAILRTLVIGRQYRKINHEYLMQSMRYAPLGAALPIEAYDEYVIGVTPEANELLELREEAWQTSEDSHNIGIQRYQFDIERLQQRISQLERQWWPQFKRWLWDYLWGRV
jgi:hypothetical protein